MTWAQKMKYRKKIWKILSEIDDGPKRENRRYQHISHVRLTRGRKKKTTINLIPIEKTMSVRSAGFSKVGKPLSIYVVEMLNKQRNKIVLNIECHDEI